MISLKRVTGGVLFGWGSTLASIAVGLFMSPFLVRHLGVTGYGVWVLVQSSVAYMYLMDLGLRSTVLRFSVHAHAQGDFAEVNRVVSAALWIRFWSAAAVMVITGVLAVALPHVFTIPQQYVLTARITVILAAASLSSILLFNVYSAVLSSLGRFDLLGLLELIQTLAMSVGLVPIVLSGCGLVSMAAWQLAVVLAINLTMVVKCYRLYPTLRLSFGFPEKDLLRSLWNFSFYVLLLTAANQMILYADNLVVGAMITTAAVSYYAIAAKMVEYLRQGAVAILKNFMPLASSFVARNEEEKLRQLHLHGTQAVLLVTYPIAAMLFLRGYTFFRLWIGEEFAVHATPVLRILVLAAMVMLASSGNNGLALALGKQRLLALVTMAEGVTNLLLSIFLARRYGVIGVAIGTAIPAAISSLLFWPQYLCRQLKLALSAYIARAWLMPIAAVAPFAFASSWIEHHWQTNHLYDFLFQVLVLLPVLFAGVLLVFFRQVPMAYNLLFGRNRRMAEAS